MLQLIILVQGNFNVLIRVYTYCTSIVSHLVGDKSQYIPSTFSQYLWQLIFLFAHIDIELQKNLI